MAAYESRLGLQGEFRPLQRALNPRPERSDATDLQHSVGGPPPAAHPLLQLQRMHGNRYVQRVVVLLGKDGDQTEEAPKLERAIHTARVRQTPDISDHAQVELAVGKAPSRAQNEVAGFSRRVAGPVRFAGQDIFFSQGEYHLQRSSDRELLVHRLACVVRRDGDQVELQNPAGRVGQISKTGGGKHVQRQEYTAESSLVDRMRAVLDIFHQFVQRATLLSSVRENLEQVSQWEREQASPHGTLRGLESRPSRPTWPMNLPPDQQEEVRAAIDGLQAYVPRPRVGAPDAGVQDPRAIEQSIQRIRFVLRYFLAINDPSLTDRPTLEEAERVGDPSLFDDDLYAVFGVRDDSMAVFVGFAQLLQKQIRSRSAMHTEMGREPGLVPSLQDVEDYFTALKLRKASNDEVRTAYQQYAGGFFQHAGIADAGFPVSAVTDIFDRPVSIAGTRLLVCYSFALLGVHLLEKAGAEPVNFFVGARVSEHQLGVIAQDIAQGNDSELPELTDVHALGHVRRRGEDLYISNQGFADDASGDKPGGGFSTRIAWENPNNKLFLGSGPTIEAAAQKALRSIYRAAEALNIQDGR